MRCLSDFTEKEPSLLACQVQTSMFPLRLKEPIKLMQACNSDNVSIKIKGTD
ncbi:hypothetical protein HanRHA438_Chr09g0413711 [Helianthus annuus]|nr:hypothetical protein HanIR_Chr09g0432961 [Helianthus annuus]KAJ0889517.1 hypothetical protein HanRHA438_Chr09g0413711 [Helianthus annuus]